MIPIWLTTLLPSLFALARPKIASIVGKDKVDLVIGAFSQTASENKDMLDTQIKALSNSDDSQNEINKIAARSDHGFQRNARPFLIWLMIFGLGWGMFGYDWANAIMAIMEIDYVFTKLDTTAIFTMLAGTMGLSIVRHFDKSKLMGNLK